MLHTDSPGVTLIITGLKQTLAIAEFLLQFVRVKVNYKQNACYVLGQILRFDTTCFTHWTITMGLSTLSEFKFRTRDKAHKLKSNYISSVPQGGLNLIMKLVLVGLTFT